MSNPDHEVYVDFTVWHVEYDDHDFTCANPTYTAKISFTFVSTGDMMEDLDRVWCVGNGEGLRTPGEENASMLYRRFCDRSLMVGDLISVNEAVFRIASIGFDLAPEFAYLLKEDA